MMVPFDSEDLKGIVYVWVGSKADHTEAQIAEDIAYKMYKVFVDRNKMHKIFTDRLCCW